MDSANTDVDAAARHAENYLQKRGYTSPESAQRRDAAPPVSAERFVFNQSLLDVDSSVLESILTCYNPAEANQPRVVVESYRRVKAWVDDSLDLYKPELQIALYPLFVQVFLDIMQRGFATEARHFFESHLAEYADQYPADIQQLTSITEAHHVGENALATMFLENKYTIAMSSYAFELLVSYLQDSKFMTLLKYMNQHLNVKVYAAKPLQALAKDVRAVIGLTGHTSQEIRAVNEQRLHSGRQQPDATFMELVARKIKEEDDLIREAQTVEQQSSMVTLTQLFRDYKGEQAYEKAPPTADAIPLPPKTTKEVLTEIEAIKDLRYRVKLSARILPSAVMYTVHNTYEGANCMSFTQDATRLAAGFSDSYIKVWSLNGERLRSLKGSTELSASDFEHASDWGRGREPIGDLCKKLVGHSGPVYGTSFSPDNKYLVSGSEDGTARLWSMDTYSNVVVYKGHNYPVWDVDFGPQGAYFVTASHDRTARLWSCERIHPLRIFAGHLSDVECVRFHPNSNYILTGSADRSLRLWDVQRGKCVRVFTAGHPTTAANILSVAVSPDGQTAASGADDGSIVVWDLGSGGVIKRYGRAATGVSGGVSVSNDGSVYSLEFSADGSVLAAGTADGFVSFWETKRTGIASGTADKRHQSGGPSMDDGVYGKK